jgi:diguanylate cyclase (GGDEF)-like protein/PAS domain S-box-containing protein
MREAQQYFVPRNLEEAARFCAALTLCSALLQIVFTLTVPEFSGGQVWLTLTGAAVGAGLGVLALAVPRRLPSVFWFLVPVTGVLLVFVLDLVTRDATVSGQIYFFLPVLFAAYELRAGLAAIVLVEATVATATVQCLLDPGTGALTGTGGMAVSMAVATWLLVRSRERERRLVQGLAARERHVRALVAGSSDVIALCEPDGTVTYLSLAARTVFGHDPDDVCGRRIQDLAHPEDAAALTQALAGARGRGTPGDPVQVTWRIRGPQGSWRDVEAVIADQLDDPDVGALVLHVRDITERLSLQAQLGFRTFHDELTGLPNRALLRDRLQRALNRSGTAAGCQVGLLCIDLDGFKAVNDTLGHDHGDLLLRVIADRLDTLGSGGMVARLGGDEFAVLLPEVDGPERCATVAEQALAVIREPLEIDGRPITVSASIGFAVAHPGMSGTDLLRDADLAMYAAKARQNQAEAFTPALRVEAMARFDLQNELRNAVRAGDLVLYYQPVVDLETGATVSVEALVRWDHPTRGLLSPLLFIPLAEESGIIQALGAWVLDEAVRQTAIWNQQGAALSVSVNLSVREVRDGLASRVAATLAEAGLSPDLLVLELTESLFLEGTPELEELALLRRTGVRLAIDDFGTGYSSLSYLGRLPVDILKIDRSFTSGVGAVDELTALTDGIVALGQRLGLTVLAEGIETETQLTELRRMGCRRGQGFLFSRPVPVPELARHLGLAEPPRFPIRPRGSAGDSRVTALAGPGT